MRTNSIKTNLRDGKPSVGSWINVDSVFSARLMARAGFPWLCVDMEHSAIDWGLAATLFGFIAEAGSIPLCRVPNGTHENIKRALDAGAWGIVAPMVDTVEQARDIVAACKYPPEGSRSVGSGSHFLSFGASDGDYKARANQEILVVLQTESPLGVENAEAIYSVPGVDAIFVGPNDLRAQMRKTTPGNRVPTVDEYEVLLARVLAAGKKTGTPVGLHTFSIEECQERAREGYQFMAILSDAGFLSAEASRHVKALDLLGSHAPTSALRTSPVVGGASKY